MSGYLLSGKRLQQNFPNNFKKGRVLPLLTDFTNYSLITIEYIK